MFLSSRWTIAAASLTYIFIMYDNGTYVIPGSGADGSAMSDRAHWGPWCRCQVFCKSSTTSMWFRYDVKLENFTGLNLVLFDVPKFFFIGLATRHLISLPVQGSLVFWDWVHALDSVQVLLFCNVMSFTAYLLLFLCSILAKRGNCPP